MDDNTPDTPPERPIDWRIRRAMRIFENEQTPLAAVADVAERAGLSVFDVVRLFEAQVGLSPADCGRAVPPS